VAEDFVLLALEHCEQLFAEVFFRVMHK
jgi:hypothetical protein